jgi:hypothetical protein
VVVASSSFVFGPVATGAAVVAGVATGATVTCDAGVVTGGWDAGAVFVQPAKQEIIISSAKAHAINPTCTFFVIIEPDKKVVRETIQCFFLISVNDKRLTS